jgi:hypothetical protein
MIRCGVSLRLAEYECYGNSFFFLVSARGFVLEGQTGVELAEVESMMILIRGRRRQNKGSQVNEGGAKLK